jgi:hypothetical protein
VTAHVTRVICCSRRVAATIGALGCVGAALAALVALPAPAAAAISLPAGGVAELSASDGVALLGQAPLGTEGVPASAIEAPVLVAFFAARPGISELASLSALGGAEGLEQALALAIEQLAEEGQPVEEMVGPRELATDLEEQLEAAYEESAGAEEPGAPETLQELVEQELGKTPGELIEEGTSLGLGELLSVWLAEAADPARLTGALFAAVEPAEVEGFAEAALSGEPFTLADVAETAAAVELSPAELAAALGQSTSELPESARALLAPLGDGRWLGVLVGAKGPSFAAFGPPPHEEPEEEPEEEGEGAEGGGGEEGGGATPPPVEPGAPPGGSGGGPGASTAMATPLATAATSAPAAGPPSSAPTVAATLARVKILSRRAKGTVVKLVLQVPAAGTLLLRGNGLRTVRHTTAAARRLTLELRATAASAAALRKHKRVRIRLRATFTPSAGAVSSTSTTVVLG